MRIYISGPMTGVPNYKEKFEDAEKYLAEKGYNVFNPAKVDEVLPADMIYDEIMEVDLCLLRMCDAIYMLDGWLDSKGAWIEIKEAMNKCMPIYLQATNKMIKLRPNVPVGFYPEEL